MKKLLVLLGTVLLFSVTAGFQTISEKTEKPFHPAEFGDRFLKGDYEAVYSQTSSEFKAEVPLKDFIQLADEFNKGVTGYKLSSHLTLNRELKQYTWTDQTGTKGISVIVQKDYTISGLNLVPLEQHESDKSYTKNKYTMPFKGRWLVYWGGTNVLLNYHYPYESQRYAYDFLEMRRGQTYKGDPAENENYFAFGKPVTAPLEGKVAAVADGIKDNVPGELNAAQPAGNHVIIQHKNGEYSILAHFKKNSIKVRKGDRVRTGQILGECGNSGNSTEAHIHFQVSSSPDLMKGKSVRIRFADGKEPVRGEFVKK